MGRPASKRNQTDGIEDESITGITSAQFASLGSEFRRCSFSALDLSHARLTGMLFSECEFIGCNLALANISGSSFQSVNFTDCKLTGLRFDQCQAILFTAGFRNCILDRASFIRLKAKKTEFVKCSLKEADLSESDLSGSLFELCNCERANFEGTNLEKADLRTSYNFTIDPEKTKLKKALFSASGIAGLLDKYDIVIE